MTFRETAYFPSSRGGETRTLLNQLEELTPVPAQEMPKSKAKLYYQSASSSWCQAPIRDPQPIFISPSNFLASAVPLESESRGTQDHILLSQFLRLPQPGGPGPVYNNYSYINSREPALLKKDNKKNV
jgi:hypothetical protein